jgi:hypothetical protein
MKSASSGTGEPLFHFRRRHGRPRVAPAGFPDMKKVVNYPKNGEFRAAGPQFRPRPAMKTLLFIRNEILIPKNLLTGFEGELQAGGSLNAERSRSASPGSWTGTASPTGAPRRRCFLLLFGFACPVRRQPEQRLGGPIGGRGETAISGDNPRDSFISLLFSLISLPAVFFLYFL